jgi:hypothetical protein
MVWNAKGTECVSSSRACGGKQPQEYLCGQEGVAAGDVPIVRRDSCADPIQNDVAGSASGMRATTVANEALQAEQVAFSEHIPQLPAVRVVFEEFDAPLLNQPNHLDLRVALPEMYSSTRGT